MLGESTKSKPAGRGVVYIYKDNPCHCRILLGLWTRSETQYFLPVPNAPQELEMWLGLSANYWHSLMALHMCQEHFNANIGRESMTLCHKPNESKIQNCMTAKSTKTES